MKTLFKTISLLFLLTMFGFTTFGQNDKCLAFSNDIIKDIKGKVITQYVGVNDIYTIKTEVSQTYDVIKTACDSTKFKSSFDWRINYDKNYEKSFLVYGKNVVITFYPNDKILYFEFPKN